jgi:hypothetical protein
MLIVSDFFLILIFQSRPRGSCPFVFAKSLHFRKLLGVCEQSFTIITLVSTVSKSTAKKILFWLNLFCCCKNFQPDDASENLCLFCIDDSFDVTSIIRSLINTLTIDQSERALVKIYYINCDKTL